MNHRFPVIMMVGALFLVVMTGSQAYWGREAVEPWVVPGIWIYIFIVTALGYFWDKAFARTLAVREEESARKLAEIRKGPSI